MHTLASPLPVVLFWGGLCDCAAQADVVRAVQVHTSQASAAQRAGRAGRLGPGVCYRTWSDKVHERRNVVDEPAILREDPLPAVVEAAVWGDATLAQNMLPLLTRPRKARWQKAIERLLAMRVLRREGNGYEIMDQARAEGLAMLPVAPHCAHMILECAPFCAAILTFVTATAVTVQTARP